MVVLNIVTQIGYLKTASVQNIFISSLNSLFGLSTLGVCISCLTIDSM